MSKCKKESCGCQSENKLSHKLSQITCCMDLQKPKDPLTILLEKEEEQINFGAANDPRAIT